MYEGGCEYEFSVLSKRFRFAGREFQQSFSFSNLKVANINRVGCEEKSSEQSSLYFLSQLKRARVAKQDLVPSESYHLGDRLLLPFYTSCIRSILTYASPVFFYALPEYLKNELERIQKRALRIICPGHCYNDAMELANIVPISDYILEICKQTFDRIINDSGHRLYSLVQQRGPSQYALRRTKRFSVPKCKTERCMNSFIIRSSINYL